MEYGREELEAAFRRAVDLGVGFFDTAEIYGGGASERLLGEFSKGYGEGDIIIATKVWPTHIWRKGVIKAARRSLDRLGREAIDLYQVHWPNPLIPLGSTARGMLDLLEAGSIRAIGVSNYGPGRMARFHRLVEGRLATNQVRYSLLHWREVEAGLLPRARELDVVILAYSPLDQGAVAGKYGPESLPRDRVRRINPWFTPTGMRRVKPLAAALEQVAAQRGVTVVVVVLAFLMARGVIPIVGVKRPEQVDPLAQALELTLTPEEVALIEEARSRIAGPGIGAYLWLPLRLLGVA